MRRTAHRLATFGILLMVLSVAAPGASASTACVHRGDRTLASSPRLVLLAPSGGATGARLVCRRDSGTRRTLARPAAGCSHCVTRIKRVALRGRFAYAVVSNRAFNDQQAELITLDTDTWRSRRAALDLGDQSDLVRSDVSDLVALPRGSAVLRVRNDFAAGVVLAEGGGAVWLDEGLATAIGRPRVAGARVIWRHGTGLRASPTRPLSHCPRAPVPGTASSRLLATADAVTSGGWYCVRATGRLGRLDGVVVRLLGSLAVVQRPADVRVVDLRTATTIAGPAAADANARNNPTVGPSGTLVLRRFGSCAGDAEIVALAAGMPERRLACGDLRDLRYVDGVVRFRDQATGQVVTSVLP